MKTLKQEAEEVGINPTTYRKRIERGWDKEKALTVKVREKHDMWGTREYSTWHNMKLRCYNSNSIRYKDYGGRGIFVCRRWRSSFKNFYRDMGSRPKGLSIDRIDNNKGYGKWNCKWSTAKEQRNNQQGISVS